MMMMSAKMTSLLQLLTLTLTLTLMMMMMMLTPGDARVNLTAGRLQMMDKWWDPKFTRQSLEPDERYYFEQVRYSSNCYDNAARNQ